MNNDSSERWKAILVTVFAFFLGCALLFAFGLIIRDIMRNDSQYICQCECCENKRGSGCITVRNESYIEKQQENPYIYTPTISMF